MININLTHLSVFIIAIWLSSFFVNADESTTYKKQDDSAPSSEKFTKIKSESSSGNRFTFTSLDSDQNGKLSQKEVAQGKNNWLAKAFDQIDINADAALTEQELVDFAAKVASDSKPTT